MKMAKASKADIDMAMDLASVLDDIESGYFPLKLSDDQDSEEAERIDTTDHKQYERLIDSLRRLLNRGSIFRVIFGMAVVCDPSNECIDPDAGTIEHHPKRQQLEEQRDLLLSALEKCKFDSLNMSIQDLEFCRAAVASVRKAKGQCYYAPDGMLMNPDGSRSIFDDVDQ